MEAIYIQGGYKGGVRPHKCFTHKHETHEKAVVLVMHIGEMLVVQVGESLLETRVGPQYSKLGT